MLITGYFLAERGKKINLSKSVINLVSMIGFATVAVMIGSLIYYNNFRTEKFIVSLQGIGNFNGGWWFAGYYLVVIIIGALWLNDYLTNLEQKKYLSLLIVLFGACSISWIGSVIENIAGGLRTVVGGVFLYALGGYIKKYNPFGNVKILPIILMIAFVYLLVWVSYYNNTLNSIQTYLQGDRRNPYVQVKSGYADYSIVTMTLALCIFELFRRLKVPNNKVINFFAKASFMVYLVHDNDFIRRIWREHDFIYKLHISPLWFIGSLLKWMLFIYILGTCVYTCFLGTKRLIIWCKPLVMKKTLQKAALQ